MRLRRGRPRLQTDDGKGRRSAGRTRAFWRYVGLTGRYLASAAGLVYEQLIRTSPTVGTLTGCAAAVGEAKGPEAGLAVLDGIDVKAVSGYQPYWAVRAHLLQRLRKTTEAKDAYNRAIGLTEDPAAKEFLLQRRS